MEKEREREREREREQELEQEREREREREREQDDLKPRKLTNNLEKNMNIDELTYGQIKQLMRDFANTNDDLIDHPYKIGKSYIIRTATHTQTGRLLKVTDQELVFEDAAWIADSGRWFDALQTGDLDEIEPFVDPVIVGRGALIDCTEWNHPLPRNQK